MNRLTTLLLAAVLLLPAAASADDRVCTVILGGTVYAPEGPRDDLVIVLLGERIADARPKVEDLQFAGPSGTRPSGRSADAERHPPAPASGSGEGAQTARFRGQHDCAVIKLDEGAVVTTGLVSVGGQLGLVEVGMESATRTSDGGGEPVRASHDVADSYNPRSAVIPVARISGITSAIIEPTGGMIAGQAAWVDLSGGSQEEAVVRRGVSFPASFASASRGEAIGRLRELLDDARTHLDDPRALAGNRSRPYTASRLDLEALAPVLEGTAPLVIGANRASDIEALIRFAEAEEIRLVIRGGAEAWLHADALARAGVAVIINPLVYGPGGFGQIEARPDNARLLAEAGVSVIISTGSAHFARNLRQLAGNAVRGGMDHLAAVRSITSVPAEVFGQTDRGEIARGAVANLVIWSGDPLELSSAVQHLFIGGRSIELRSRQTELLERYRTLPGSPVPALEVPDSL